MVNQEDFVMLFDIKNQAFLVILDKGQINIFIRRFCQLCFQAFENFHRRLCCKNIDQPGRKSASRVQMYGIFKMYMIWSQWCNDPFTDRIIDPYDAFFYWNKSW